MTEAEITGDLLVPFYSDATCSIGTYSNVLISVWKQPPTEQQSQHIRAASSELLARTSGPTAGLTVVLRPEKTVANVNSNRSMRESMTDLFRSLEGRSVGFALVVEVPSWLLLVVRGVFSAVVTMSGADLTYKLFNNRNDGCTWLCSQLHDVVKPHELINAIERLSTAIK